jgi:hypothetical protein
MGLTHNMRTIGKIEKMGALILDLAADESAITR